MTPRVLPTLLLLVFCWSCCSAEERTRNLRLSRTRNFFFQTAAPQKPDEFTSFPSSAPTASPVQHTAPPRPDFTDFPSAKGPQDETEPPLVVFPLGEHGEEQVLAEKAAVCAEGLSQAQALCEESPVCKYVLDSDGNMTDDLAPGQAAGCVRRCDTPQGSNACGLHDQCHHFVVTCSV